MLLQNAEVIVVGAGLSGLTAAWRLAWAGRDVRVLEAGSRLGGRILTRAFASGQPVELGAGGVGVRQARLRQLVSELGLALESPPDGFSALGLEPLYGTAMAGLSWPARVQLRRFWQRLERQAAALPPEPAAQHALAQALDRQRLADCLQQHWLGREARQLSGEMAELLFGAAPAELSLLQALLQLRRYGGCASLAELRLGHRQLRPAAGMQAICRGLTARLGEGLILDTPLLALEQDDNAVELLTPHGRYRASRVVLALPALQLARLNFSPALSGSHDHTLSHLLPQATLDAQLRYERPFWRGRLPRIGLPLRSAAGCLIREQPPVREGEGALRVRLDGELARHCAGLDEPARRGLLLDTLGKLLGEPARTPLECLLQCWADDPFLRGSEAQWSAGGWSLLAPQLSRPLGRVHFAGADLARRWPGTLEGAVEAGERAAEEVLGLG